jgi:hypothetical protein
MSVQFHSHNWATSVKQGHTGREFGLAASWSEAKVTVNSLDVLTNTGTGSFCTDVVWENLIAAFARG